MQFGLFPMAEEMADRPTVMRTKAEKTETNRKWIAEQLATALREAGFECLIVFAVH